MAIPLNQVYVMLPAFNEEAVIYDVIRKIVALGFPNILVIDDGSTDDTPHLAEDAGAQIVQHMVNRGAGAACQTGIELARRKGWNYIVFMDADGQHCAKDLDAMIGKMSATDCDLVIGSRFITRSKDMPPTRVVFNGIANLMTSIFCKKKYSDSQSGFRLLNRKAIEQINLRIDGFGFCSEMLIIADRLEFNVEEIPIHVNYSSYSISKGQDFQVGINTALNFLWSIIFK